MASGSGAPDDDPSSPSSSDSEDSEYSDEESDRSRKSEKSVERCLLQLEMVDADRVLHAIQARRWSFAVRHDFPRDQGACQKTSSAISSLFF